MFMDLLKNNFKLCPKKGCLCKFELNIGIPIPRISYPFESHGESNN